ncbi:MAG TPA: glycolate oxidase subunit GlcF [Alphaproteobacteria bacterium]|nr:glycolate oxidase subunit GlcF [Alphaproteobacteria bacterium]
MQTHFTEAQKADPDIAESDKILRACVHCGFCTATCPTYVLLGDELDSPRGRIYLIKDMLENDRPATPEVVKHIDRCLSCLACMTTCPSGVHYMHLVDHARKHIEETYRRPWFDRVLRSVLAKLIPYPDRFKAALALGALAKPLGPLFPARLKAMLALAPLPAGRSPLDMPGIHGAEGERKYRVALLPGCAQRAIAPNINEATIRLLARHGAETVYPASANCCGSLVHHMGREREAHAQAKAMIDAWWPETAEGGGQGLDAIIINASGCGTTVKDYGFMLRNDAAYAEKAALISKLTRDVSEFMAEIGLSPPAIAGGQRVTYHAACSLQHGQRVRQQPKKLLADAGFAVSEPAEGHLCCGSAGTYNLLQPEIATRLRDRKLANIARTTPEIVATGNIGCITQLDSTSPVPVVHTVELLDWATGGPKPKAIR